MWRLMTDRNSNKFTIQTILNNLDNPKKTNIFDEFKSFIEMTGHTLKLKE